MTALYMAVTESGIVMMTDGVAYDGDGVIRQIHQKQLVRSDIGVVAASSGSGPFCQLLDALCTEYSPASFDDFHRLMPGMLRLALGDMERWRKADLAQGKTWATEQKSYAFILYGGYSDEQQKFIGYCISTYLIEPFGPKSLEPFTPEPMRLFAKPETTPEARRTAGLGDDMAADLARDGAQVYGAKLILAMRRSPYALHGVGSVMGYGVGGFVQYTFLERNRATTDVLWRWPDEIGRVIDPDEDVQIVVGQPSNVDSAEQEALGEPV